MTNKGKRMIKAVSGIAVVAMIAGSLAYWNQTHTIDNPFNTGEKYSSTVIEDFNPGDGENWQPGVEVDKGVKVVNTGDQDIIIRVKLDEKWVRKEETLPYQELLAEPDKDVYNTGQANPSDGMTTGDGSVVIKNLSTSEKWIDGRDGWFYYKVNLKGGETSDQWLTSVELLDNLDLGVQEVLHYVTTDEVVDANTKWDLYNVALGMPKVIDNKPVLHNKTDVTYKKDKDGNELIGYLDSNYTLTITTQTVQATEEAITATFGLTKTQLEGLNVEWVLADK